MLESVCHEFMKIILKKNNRELMMTSFVTKDEARSDHYLRSATFY